MQRLIPYSEKKGYASNPRRSLSLVHSMLHKAYTLWERYTKHAKLRTLPYLARLLTRKHTRQVQTDRT